MPTFDPNASETSPTGQSEVNDALASGDYLIRAVWFDRNVSQAGKEYLRVKWEVLAGEFANSAFFGNLSCQTDKGGVAARWRSLCTGLNIQESFEVGGPQGDKDFARLVKGKPFRARVNRTESNGYVNFDIARTYGQSTWSDGERKAAEGLLELPSDSGPESSPDDDDVPF